MYAECENNELLRIFSFLKVNFIEMLKKCFKRSSKKSHLRAKN